MKTLWAFHSVQLSIRALVVASAIILVQKYSICNADVAGARIFL
ncbi:hypothetical protein X975_19293, partial [Stegodyphus mimosarum]